MEQETITQTAEQYIAELFETKLTSDHQFHDLNHTLAVRDACMKIAERFELTEKELEVLELAALFHDVGYTQTYIGHEEVSVEIASKFLQENGFAPDVVEQVTKCIMVTRMDRSPENELEKIISDGDLSNLGSPDFFDLLGKLRYEWEVFKGEKYSDKEWYKLNNTFLKEHNFFTEAAEEIYGPKKKENRKKVKKMVKKDKQAKAGAAEKSLTISNSKSAQMMFKTALRNHLDLSNLADNKANMMLSVNAGIITIAIPLGSTYVSNFQFLLMPMIVLLITCLSSMVYATLATRPIKMNGYTDEDNIRSGKSNLFFFGNFYRMTFGEYQNGLQQVVSDEENLEGSIMRDLYFLGRSLGRKYNQLRMCYNLFMIGIIVSVLAFVVSYATMN
jgi:putative nucleotidyltransferase with HDIG domain